MAKDFLSDINFSDNLVTLTSTDDGSSAGPILELYRNSSSPADADYIGQIKFQGRHDGGAKALYAKITGKIGDASDGSEDGIIEIAHQKAGSNNISARFTSDALKLINGTGLEVAGTIQIDGATTFGVDDTGVDVKFFGATSGRYMEWDESEDSLTLVDNVKLCFGNKAGGDGNIKHTGSNLQISETTGHIQITNYNTDGDIVLSSDDGSGGETAYITLDGGSVQTTIHKTLQLDSTLTVGVDDTGYDVKFFGATASKYMLWDESADALIVKDTVDAVNFKVNGGQGSDGQVLTSTGSGVAWEDAAGGAPGGSDTQVQFNSSSSFGGSANMVFDGTRLMLTNNDDADLDAVSGALITGGDGTGTHLAFDTNEIMAKSDATTAGTLYLQNDGGTARFGNNITLTEWSVSSDTSKITSSADILQLHNTSSATTGGYIGYYTSDGTRLGYVGYPANDDLYIKQEDGDGDLYIESDNGRIYYFASTYHFWKVNNNYELRLDYASLRPYTNEGLTLGASGAAWDKLYLGQGSTFSSGGFWTLRSRDSDRQVMEYTSSERWKKDIVDLPVSEAYQILDARPIKFRGIDDDESVPLEAGLSAESLHEAGYEYAVRYDEGHWGETPRAVYYEMLTAPLIAICKDQKAKIEALEARVAALE